MTVLQLYTHLSSPCCEKNRTNSNVVRVICGLNVCKVVSAYGTKPSVVVRAREVQERNVDAGRQGFDLMPPAYRDEEAISGLERHMNMWDVSELCRGPVRVEAAVASARELCTKW